MTEPVRRIVEINQMWKADAPFATDLLGLIAANSANYSLHQKYLDIKTIETRKLAKKSREVEKFRFKLMRFYRDGTDDRETLEVAAAKGWAIPPEGKPHLKTDIKHWVETNDDMTLMVLELSDQNDIVDQVNSILKAIDARSYSINKTMDAVMHSYGK